MATERSHTVRRMSEAQFCVTPAETKAIGTDIPAIKILEIEADQVVEAGKAACGSACKLSCGITDLSRQAQDHSEIAVAVRCEDPACDDTEVLKAAGRLRDFAVNRLIAEI